VPLPRPERDGERPSATEPVLNDVQSSTDERGPIVTRRVSEENTPAGRHDLLHPHIRADSRHSRENLERVTENNEAALGRGGC
jgi:hypothetical protein